MDFAIPADLQAYLDELDAFIAAEIKPLEQQDDNIRFFDHRREYARTDFEAGGLPRHEWEELLKEATRRSDKAGHWRFSAPKRYGGKDGSNLWMAVIREHFARQGLGLHNDLQNEHSIVGNFPFVAMFDQWGTEEQKQEFILGGFERTRRVAFGLTEPDHGSDATHMETVAVRETRDGVEGWRIDGEKMWITGMHVATHCAMFARTAGKAGDASGITCFLVPNPTEGLKIEEWMWTFNMPTDHPRLSVTNVWVPDSAILGVEGRGLALAQSFVHQNRIRQAASQLRRGALLHRRKREIRPPAQALRRGAGAQSGDPVPAGGTRDAGGDAAAADLQDRVGDGQHAPRTDRTHHQRQGLDVQLLGEPTGVRGGGPGDAGPRRHRLFAAQAVRAYLSASPPLPDHRRHRRRSRCARWGRTCSDILGPKRGMYS